VCYFHIFSLFYYPQDSATPVAKSIGIEVVSREKDGNWVTGTGLSIEGDGTVGFVTGGVIEDVGTGVAIVGNRIELFGLEGSGIGWVGTGRVGKGLSKGVDRTGGFGIGGLIEWFEAGLVAFLKCFSWNKENILNY